MKKAIISIAVCVVIAIIAFLSLNISYYNAISSADTINTVELSGSWKLTSIQAGWLKTTAPAKLEEKNFAVYYVDFLANNEVDISFAPEKGELNTNTGYVVQNNWIILDNFDGAKMKMQDGKLVYVHVNGIIKSVFTLEKQQ